MFIFATVHKDLNEKFTFEIKKADMESCAAVYVRFIIFPVTTAIIYRLRHPSYWFHSLVMN